MSLNEILQPLPKVWSNASFNSINVDSGGIINNGNITVQNANPNISILNNAANTNRATLELQGATGLLHAKIQQDNIGHLILENFQNAGLELISHGAGSIDFFPADSGDVNIVPNTGNILLSTGAGNIQLSSGAGGVKITGVNYPVGPYTLGLDSVNNLIPEGVLTSFPIQLNFGGAHVGMTLTTQTGWYMKFGRMTMFQVTLQLSAKGSSTGAATLDGFPFTSTSNPVAPPFNVFAIQDYTGITLSGTMSGSFGSNSSSAGLIDVRTSGVVTMNDTNFSNSSFLTVNGWYFTN